MARVFPEACKIKFPGFSRMCGMWLGNNHLNLTLNFFSTQNKNQVFFFLHNCFFKFYLNLLLKTAVSDYFFCIFKVKIGQIQLSQGVLDTTGRGFSPVSQNQ